MLEILNLGPKNKKTSIFACVKTITCFNIYIYIDKAKSRNGAIKYVLFICKNEK